MITAEDCSSGAPVQRKAEPLPIKKGAYRPGMRLFRLVCGGQPFRCPRPMLAIAAPAACSLWRWAGARSGGPRRASVAAAPTPRAAQVPSLEGPREVRGIDEAHGEGNIRDGTLAVP